MISQPHQTLDCEGRLHFFFFYFTVRSTLNFTRATAGPSCPVAPGRNIMFVYLRREFIPLIHWPAPLRRLEGFDFLFIYSLHFSSCALRVVSQVIPGEKFLPPQRGPLRNEIRDGRKMRDRGQGGVMELLFIVIWPLLSTRFVLTFNIGGGGAKINTSAEAFVNDHI